MERTGYTMHELEWGIPYVTCMVMLVLALEHRSEDLQMGVIKRAFGK